MYTYSGVLVDDVSGTPSTRDVAIALGRLPRLCGASRVWWSYLHHAFSLAELALLENEHYNYDKVDVVTQALVREAHASVTVLWHLGRDMKDEIQTRIHMDWRVPYPQVDSTMRELLDRASARTFLAEVDNYAPEEMKKLPIFGDTPTDDCNVLRGIWSCNSSVEASAGHNSEMVKAYQAFFVEYNIDKLRHRLGYDTRDWFLKLCVSKH